MTSIKVAVRVRPFNSREKDANSVSIIRMEGGDTYIRNPQTDQEKKFGFDYSYWSHDGYKEPEYEKQYLSAVPGSPYIDQDRVFSEIGLEMLNNAFEGYNACLFAYGQTGSGKSYSIVGYGENKGIVPRACEDIFKRISHLQESNKEKIIECQVTVSMIEIYNEKVQDLFVVANKRPKEGLKVREHPKTGVYVDGVTDVPVSSYEEIDNQFNVGNMNRTIGQTQMNATSSRAHTVNRIIFKQRFINKETGKPERELVSNINIIDLAGSERAESTGATGDRLKEGANINKSLSILGRVIGVLAKKADGQAKNEQVPYRESKLTLILKPFLGGNARTAMVAALSPASINYDETRSTLNYAWQVKAIKNNAVVNESAQDKLIRELKEEIERLRGSGAIPGNSAGGAGSAGPGDHAANEELQRKMKEQEEAFEEMQREKDEYERKLQEQQKEQSAQYEKEQRLKTTPQLRNINQDPSMSGMIKYALTNGDNFVGKKNAQFEPAISIQGVGIANKQCCLNYNIDEKLAMLVPNEDNPVKFSVKVNGERVEEPVTLHHGDRILIGDYQYYLYVDPLVDFEANFDWNAAMKEANKEQLAQFNVEEDYSEKLKEMEEKLKKEQEEKQKELEEARLRLEQEKVEQEAELERRKQEMLSAGTDGEETMKKLQIQREEFEKKVKEQEQQLEEDKRKAKEELEQQMRNQLNDQQRLQQLREIDAKLQEIVPIIAETNTICREIGMEQVFYEPDINTEVKSDGTKVSRVVVRVYADRTNKEESGIIPCDVFTDVIYFNVKEKFEEFEDSGVVDKVDDDAGENFGWALSDSWHEIGCVYIFLLSMFNLIDTPKDESPIIDTKGIKNGMQQYAVHMEILDYDKTTKLDILEYENLRELIGKHIKVKFSLKRATEIPEKYSFKTMAKYDWIDPERTGFETQVKEQQKNPDFGYVTEHTEKITEELVEYMTHNTLTVKIMGMIESKKTKAKKKQENYASDYQEEQAVGEQSAATPYDAQNGSSPTKQKTIAQGKGGEKRMDDLQRQNEELIAQLKAAQAAGGQQKACCTIF